MMSRVCYAKYMQSFLSKLKHIFMFSLIFLLLILPSLIITYVAYNQLHTQLTERTLVERQTLARQMALTVESRLDAIQGVGIASAGDIAPTVEKGEWSKAIKELEHISNEFPYIDRIFLSDTKGRTLAYHPPSPENTGRDLSFRDWYKGVSKNWEPYVSEVFKRAPHPQFNTVGVMTPIKNAKGEPLGAVGFAVNLDTFYKLTNEFKVDRGGFLYIVNQKGQIVAHPKYDPQGPIVDFSSVPIVQSLLKGESGIRIAYNPVDDETRLGAYERIDKYDWGVVVADPIETAFIERNKILNERLFINALFVLLNAILALIVLGFITQLRKSKNAVRIEKEKVDQLLKLLPVGVFLVEAPSGKVLMVNDKAREFLGKGIDPSVKKDSYTKVYETVNDDGSPYPNDELPLVQTLTTGQPVLNKTGICAKRPDGTSIALRVTSVPIKDIKGNMVSVIVVFEDITKEREVDRMKTEFISLASHQLRTPLSAMKWFLEMLLNGDAGKLSKQQEELVSNVNQSNERMIALVNSLLNVSRLESGRVIVDPELTNLGDLVKDVVKELAVKLHEKQQKILVTIDEHLPQISIDPKLLRQVYMNLLTNAIKYSPENKKITITIYKKDSNVISEIIDQGYGIPVKDKHKVFSKFYRGENITKVDTDGNGLGLYLVKEIIEASDGKIWFESKENEGTIFTVSLPIKGSKKHKGDVSIS